MRGSPGLSAGGKAQFGAPWAEGVVRTGRLWVSPKTWLPLAWAPCGTVPRALVPAGSLASAVAGNTEVTYVRRPWALASWAASAEGPREGWPPTGQAQREGLDAGPGPRSLSSRASANQPAWTNGPIGWRVSLLREAFVLLRPQAADDKRAFSRYDSHWWGSLAPGHVSTLDLLRVHWPEIMSPMRAGGRDIRSGRFGVFSPLLETLNMHYWIATPSL